MAHEENRPANGARTRRPDADRGDLRSTRPPRATKNASPLPPHRRGDPAGGAVSSRGAGATKAKRKS